MVVVVLIGPALYIYIFIHVSPLLHSLHSNNFVRGRKVHTELSSHTGIFEKEKKIILYILCCDILTNYLELFFVLFTDITEIENVTR